MILMFLSLETMLSGVSINLIAFSRLHMNYQGQILAIMVLTVAACEAAIALALIVSLYRRKATLDVEAWDELSETLVPKTMDETGVTELKDQEFPKLTKAGLDPGFNPVPSSLETGNESVSRPLTSSSSEATSRA
jgi:NADH-quinone oxidoreductase subunit K